MLTALLLGLGSIAEGVEAPSTAVFVAPLTVVTGAAYGEVQRDGPGRPGRPGSAGSPIVYVSLGANLTAADIDWSFDVALMQMTASPLAAMAGAFGPASISRQGFIGGWLAMGPMFQTGRALHGFFLNPKITLGVFFIGRDAMILDALVGADVGYQFTIGRVYFAFVLGASFGVGWSDDDLLAGPMKSTNLAFFGPAAGPAVGVNLQLFRMGFTF